MPDTPVTAPEPAWAAFVALDWGSQKHAWILEPTGGTDRSLYIRRALAGRPSSAAYLNSLGAVCRALGQLDEAQSDDDVEDEDEVEE
jgi:hypothetical protein